jgi:transcriptional regulator with XRE-family HTH domain
MLMPAGDTRRQPPSLATKLDRLFQAVRPAGRSEYSYQEVADAIRGEGGPTISATYLWQLRKGLRDNPTRNHLAALARFFGVSPAYFFDDDAAEVVDAQLSLLAAMRDASVRSVALRAAGLSVESLAAVQVVIDHARRLEGLEAESGTEDPGRGPESSGADGTGADAAGADAARADAARADAARADAARADAARADAARADRAGAGEAGAGGQDGDHARGGG